MSTSNVPFPLPHGAKFCNRCGHEALQLQTGAFDLQTGKPSTVPACVNTACLGGCLNVHGAHDYGLTWLGRRRQYGTCRRCNYVSAMMED